MKATEGLKLVGGSILVYCIMAACSASSGPGSTSMLDGSASSSGGSSSSGGNGSGSGSVFDALTDPVAEAAADPNQSGTRLKVHYYAGADGSKQTAGMHDSMLNVDCYFQPMSDGTQRCVPIYGGTGGQAAVQTYFADAACTQALATTFKGCAPPAYAINYVSAPACDWQYVWHVYSIGTPYTGASMYSLSGSTCSGPTPTSGLSSTYDIYTVGAELPPTTFVQATLQTEP